MASSILYLTPLAAPSGLSLYILNGAAFPPESSDIDYSALLPYVLARLPGEDDLLAGTEYEIIFFAGGQPDNADTKRDGPSVGWYLQAYHVLSRAMRKRLKSLYIVHERSWVRVLIEVFGTIVSPKFKRKITHVNTLSGLTYHLRIEDLLIPPSVYLHDRRVAQDIYIPHASPRAFGAPEPLPRDAYGRRRLPRVLRETTLFLCQGKNLDTEGIFRISAHSKLLGILREAYDRGQRFIVWKELGTALVEPGMTRPMLSDIADSEAYGVYLAAALIKTWYRELRTPVFTETCYHRLSDLGDLGIDELKGLLSSSSFLSGTSRTILTWHLLPLLHLISKHEFQNKMTAENLAICFTPCLVNGPDAMADAKVFPVARRLLTAAITQWPQLQEACGRTDGDFMHAIEFPEPSLYEDPISADVPPIVKLDYASPQKLPERNSSLQNKIPDRTIPPPVPRRKPAPPPSTASNQSSPTKAESDDFKPPLHPARASTTGSLIQSEKSETRSRASSTSSSGSLRRKPISPMSARPPSAGRLSHASEAASSLAPTLSQIQAQGSSLRSVSNGSATSSRSKEADDSLFVKPTWAASSRKTSASSTGSAGHVVLSSRQESFDIPRPRSASPEKVSEAAKYIGRPRAPSPGLLQRMQSWEQADSAVGSVAGEIRAPEGGRSQSVDDIKRLYEERLATASGLETARMASVESVARRPE